MNITKKTGLLKSHIISEFESKEKINNMFFRRLIMDYEDKSRRLHLNGFNNRVIQTFKEYDRFSQVTFLKICDVFLDVYISNMFMNKITTIQFVRCINSAKNIKTLGLYYRQDYDYLVNLDNLQYLLATIQVEELGLETESYMGINKFFEKQTRNHFKKFICYYKAARKENKSMAWRQYIRGRRINYEQGELPMSYIKDLLTFCARNKISISKESKLYQLYQCVLQDKSKKFKNDIQISNEKENYLFYH